MSFSQICQFISVVLARRMVVAVVAALIAISGLVPGKTASLSLTNNSEGTIIVRIQPVGQGGTVLAAAVVGPGETVDLALGDVANCKADVILSPLSGGVLPIWGHDLCKGGAVSTDGSTFTVG